MRPRPCGRRRSSRSQSAGGAGGAS
uniref:Uncharacterized protein n=1 Tax=Arundo donax TaxID=35708 RepID=A0A0A9BCG0_ARUDO